MMGTASYRRRAALLSVVLSSAIAAGCGETSINQPLPAAQARAVGSLAITGTVGTTFADPIEFVILGSDEQPLPGTAVTFSANSGGTVDPATGTTDRNGVVRTRWKFGN